jgi:hypothetical protein
MSRGHDLKVTDGAVAGGWIEPRLGEDISSVTAVVPANYEAYARVFHPAWDWEPSQPRLKPVKWADVATAFGTTAHREMQWHALIGLDESRGSPDSTWHGQDPSIGNMDLDTLDALCEILVAHTADPGRCYFGLCTIQSWLDSFSPDELKPLLELPLGRDHIVLAGPLSAVDQITRNWSASARAHGTVTFIGADDPPLDPAAQAPELDFDGRDSPNLIWPADRSWLVASEVDFDSTLVGGSAELIAAIVKSPELEAWEVEPTDSLAIDADKVNTPRGSDSPPI